MGRSLPSEREQESSPVAVYPAHPTFTAIPDRHAKSSTVPPTGSPTLAPKSGYRHRPEDDIIVQPLSQAGFPEPHRTIHRPISPPPKPSIQKQPQTTSINDFPVELQEKIINELAGYLGTPKSSHGSKNWNNAMRHPRRKQLSNLSLVSRIWKLLIQERLYRHSEYFEQEEAPIVRLIEYSQDQGDQG